MTLLTRIRQQLFWHLGLFRALLGRVPRVVLLAVAAMVAGRYARVIAFFIPLKVIILLGSDGIPRYFRFFVTEESVEIWVATLSVAVFVLYVGSIALVTVANRTVQRGALALCQPAGEKRKQRPVPRCRKHLGDLCDGTADLVIVTTGALVLLLLDWALFLALIGVVTLQIAATDRLLRQSAGLWGWLKTRIESDVKRFLQYAEAMNYLVVFLFLLIDYVLFDGKNLLVAILILLMGRRIFQSLQGFAATSLRMAPARERIEALLLPAPAAVRAESALREEAEEADEAEARPEPEVADERGRRRASAKSS